MKLKKKATEDDIMAITMFNLALFMVVAVSSGILLPNSPLNISIIIADLAVSLGIFTCVLMKSVFLEEEP